MLIYSELFVIYFDNNPDDTTASCPKNKSTDSVFQTCCEIFDIMFRNLKSNYEIKFN